MDVLYKGKSLYSTSFYSVINEADKSRVADINFGEKITTIFDLCSS